MPKKENLEIPLNLGMVVQSHLNDMMYDGEEFLTKRIKFVKALTFFNENLEKDVTHGYVYWLWDEIEKGNFGSSFADYQLNNN